MRKRRSRDTVLLEAPDVANWPTPPSDTVAAPRREEYLNNQLAVQLWAAKRPAAEIRRATGRSARQARNLAERCMRINPHTLEVVGYWGCIPGHRNGAQTRHRLTEINQAKARRGVGLCGVLDDLFRRYPAIRQKMCALVEQRLIAPGVRVPVLTAKFLHTTFLTLCKEAGVPRDEWPHNVKQRGYSAIREWFLKKRYEHPITATNNQWGEAEAQKTSGDYANARGSLHPGDPLAFERLEFDEHQLDALFSIGYPVNNQHIDFITTRRLWVLVCVDVRSHAILSSSLSYGERYNRRDVFRVLRQAVLPPPRSKLTLADPQFVYAEGAAYPAELEPFRRCTWQDLAWDNDSAHVSARTWKAVEEAIGCHVLHEKVGEPQSRPIIEGFFKRLAEMASFLPSATGNRPDSPVRRSPERAAVTYNILAPLAEELLDVTCRNYNVTPNTACKGLTPLAMLQELLPRSEVFLCPAGELRPDKLWMLLPAYAATMNRASSESRLGPLYVQLLGAKYYSADLANTPELARSANWAVTMHVEEDARYAYMVPASNPNRVFKMGVRGALSTLPHTLEWRQASNQFASDARYAGRDSLPNTMMGFLRALADVAKRDDKAAALLGAILSFMKRAGNDEVPCVSMDQADADRLLESVQNLDVTDEDEPPEADDSEPLPNEGAPRKDPPAPTGGVVF